MKLLKKVPIKEVKRAFVVADLIARPGRRRRLKADSEQEFKRKLTQVRKRVLQMSAVQLQKQVSPHWKKRVTSYDSSIWYLAKMSITELGTWKRAGGLPLSWTHRSLKYTADKVRRALETNSRSLHKRAKRAIPAILKTSVSIVQNEKYLLPIVFQSGHGTHGRKNLKHRTKGDIDDGNMRAIALAVGGVKVLRVYFGIPKKDRRVH